ncbi:hypothetical protein M422DRAFT_262554 [Sphaerobolus stellatus SS14]|uniref:Uncharacterized protein n=1 Tax=Sphaerobolus stellatus (strain SS14) TaxID=990650 RepID=A0A0C9V0M6_SPHS4|nr:hypothetical protein M422DRAFT_262554 [Sphaerobolus stellatus SS14]
MAHAWLELARFQDNSAKELLFENMDLKEELSYYVGRALLDGEDKEEIKNLPIQPEVIPQNVPIWPPSKPACPVGNKIKNNYRFIPEAGIPAIRGPYLPSTSQRTIIADPPTSITGVLPKPLGKVKAGMDPGPKCP